MTGASLHDLDTPYLAVDPDVLERNLRCAADSARERGIALRPHAKTHKVAEIAHRQIALGAVGLTVATVSEALVFADAGITDLFIAYPVWATSARSARVRALAQRVSLRLGVDSVAGVEQLARGLAGATEEGNSGEACDLAVCIEIDSGHHRSGVLPSAAPEIAVAAERAGFAVAGIFTFPGHGYAPDGRADAARDEAAALTAASAALTAHGFDAPVRSGGSTPTFGDADPGAITEVRPGVYVFNDAQQVELGTCAFADVALTAVATVVSRSGSSVIIDAGSKVLGADRAAWATGFGRLPEHPDARIVALSEHHATVQFADAAGVPTLGAVLRIAPNHVCAAVNLADELVVVRGDQVVDRWAVAARGANT